MQKTQLTTTQLGETGLEITRVGFGAWAIGGDGYQADGAIVGFRRPEQIDPILDAASLELSDEDVDEIERNMTTQGAPAN